MENKDYNIMSEQGIKDIDLIEEFGLDPALAGSPEINNAMIQKVYDDNVEVETRIGIEEGMEPRLATQSAMKHADTLKKDTIRNLRQVIKRRGY